MVYLIIGDETHDFCANTNIDGSVGIAEPIHDQVMHSGLDAMSLTMQLTNKGHKTLEGIFALLRRCGILEVGEDAMHKEVRGIVRFPDAA